MKYEIHFRRRVDSNHPRDYSKVGECETLDEARELRKVSGDIVVHASTHKVVTDPTWLWDWERDDPDSYAWRAIKSG